MISPSPFFPSRTYQRTSAVLAPRTSERRVVRTSSHEALGLRHRHHPRFPLELLPTPKEIAGIEVYDGPATVPAQFNGLDRRCGMVLVWTKDR